MEKRIEYFSSANYTKTLNFGSPTKAIAAKRDAVYNTVMGNVEAVKQVAASLGLFSSTSIDMQGGTLGVALREASLRAYLDSFAGYIAIERPLTQMKELIVYNDKITKGTGRRVAPFIGQQNPRGLAESKASYEIPVGDKDLTIELGCGIVPGSLMITATVAGETNTIIDDRKGNLLAAANIITEGKIDYNTGKLVVTFVGEPVADDVLKIHFNKDKYLENTPDRIKAVQNYFEITAKVNKFEYEMDIIAAAINQKSLGTDLAADLRDTIKDEHQMSINDQLVHAIKDNYEGTTLTIDLSTFTVASGRFDSMMKVFNSGLTSVDSAIARNCWKIVAATAYVVGNGLASLYQSIEDSNIWVPNNSGFVNGLVGFYKGRAVLRHLYCDDFEGFAIHKTANGELAPTALGIYLPATDLPIVGNFNNTNEIAGGLYAVEGADTLTNDLVQRFTVAMPADWMVVK